ncbi:MAG: response regulator [Planctomycetota bacterium]
MPQGPLRILVVDDEPDVLDVTCRLLKILGHETVAAPGGAAAIQLLQNEPFNIAVVDCHMPGVDGNAVRRFIAQNLPDLRVITASASFADAVPRSTDIMGHVFLPKPFGLRQLHGAVEQAIACGIVH